MEAITFFWGSFVALFLVIALAMREDISFSLVFSAVNALISALGGFDFYGTAAVFLLSFLFLVIVHILTDIILKIAKNRRYKRDSLQKGKRLGYVCETVYPDIPGKVMINGVIYQARSEGVFYHGDVVLCSKPADGTAVIPVKR